MSRDRNCRPLASALIAGEPRTVVAHRHPARSREGATKVVAERNRVIVAAPPLPGTTALPISGIAFAGACGSAVGVNGTEIAQRTPAGRLGRAGAGPRRSDRFPGNIDLSKFCELVVAVALIAGERRTVVLVVTLQQAAKAVKLVPERNRVIVEGAAACAGRRRSLGPRPRGPRGRNRFRDNIDVSKFCGLARRPHLSIPPVIS